MSGVESSHPATAYRAAADWRSLGVYLVTQRKALFLMQNFKIFLSLNFILFSIMVTACQAGTAEKDETSAIQQKYLFDIQHVNMAWGYYLFGIYIDDEGNVYSYQGPENWQTEIDAVEQQQSYTAEELEEKYQSAELVGTINFEDLLKHYKLIQTLDKDQLSKLGDSGCRDVGVYSFLAYEYDPAKDIYTPIIIHSAGVVWQQNLSESGVELYSWLQSLSEGEDKQEDSFGQNCGLLWPMLSVD